MTDIVYINDTITLFKRDVRAKKAINLDENILPHKKSKERKNNQLNKNLLGSWTKFWEVESNLDKIG